MWIFFRLFKKEKTNKKNKPLLRYPKINPKEEIIVVLNASFCTRPIATDKYKRSNDNYPINNIDKQIPVAYSRRFELIYRPIKIFGLRLLSLNLIRF